VSLLHKKGKTYAVIAITKGTQHIHTVKDVVCISNSHRNAKISGRNSKGDEKMNVVLRRQNNLDVVRGKIDRESSKNIKLSDNVADNLAKGKEVLKCKNGVVQIDKNHPNYNFWMVD